jgi:hypothetical protein
MAKKRKELVFAGGMLKLKTGHENGRPVLYCVLEGKRIAKRYQNESWTVLDPGYTVRGGEPGNYMPLIIERKPQ